MRSFSLAAALLLMCGTATAQTNAPVDHGAHHPAAGAIENDASDFSTAEVRKVDRDAQKVTLKHSAIAKLGMPDGMTMVFRVADPKMLDGLKPGDKVRFKADKLGGQYTVTEMDTSK